MKCIRTTKGKHKKTKQLLSKLSTNEVLVQIVPNNKEQILPAKKTIHTKNFT